MAISPELRKQLEARRKMSIWESKPSEEKRREKPVSQHNVDVNNAIGAGIRRWEEGKQKAESMMQKAHENQPNVSASPTPEKQGWRGKQEPPVIFGSK